MNNREFVRLVKHEAIDEVVRIALNSLKSPRSPIPISDSADAIQNSFSNFYNAGVRAKQKQAAWFQQLNEEQQKVFVEILHDYIEFGALSFCTLLDGVGGNYEETFEIHSIDSKGRNTLINPDNSDMLHDLLSEVCAKDRER